jgi:adenosylhomocysteine nucleosidase
MSERHPRVGFVTALEMERSWLGDSSDFEVVVCGMGRQRAENAARQLVARGVDGIVSWGIAGGLDSALDAGTVVLADRVLRTDGSTIASDDAWRRRLTETIDGHVSVSTGSIFHSDEVLTSVENKRRTKEQWAAVAVDMETGAIAAVAAESGLPWLAVRVVTDTASMGLPSAVTATSGADGRLRPAAIMKLVLCPWIWPDLARLAGSSRAAARSMRRLWSLAGPNLAMAPAAGSDR